MKDRLPPMSPEDDTPQRRIYPEPPIISAEQARPQVIHLYNLMRHVTRAIEEQLSPEHFAEIAGVEKSITKGKSDGIHSLMLQTYRFSDPLAYFMMSFSDYSRNIPSDILPFGILSGPHLDINLPLIADEKIRNLLEQWMKNNPKTPKLARTRYELNKNGDIHKGIMVPRELAVQILPPEKLCHTVLESIPAPLRTIDLTYIGAAAIEMLEALGVPKEIYSQRLEEAEGEQES